MKLTEEEKDERTSMLNDAEEKINEAIELIAQAVDGTSLEASADAYIIGHLRGWAEGTNPYDATSIPRLLEDLGKEGEDEEEEQWA